MDTNTNPAPHSFAPGDTALCGESWNDKGNPADAHRILVVTSPFIYSCFDNEKGYDALKGLSVAELDETSTAFKWDAQSLEDIHDSDWKLFASE